MFDWYGEKEAKIASLETENGVYRETNLGLNEKLKQESEAVARLTKSYQDEVGRNGKLNLEVGNLMAKLLEALQARDHNQDLATERFDVAAALSDENKDLLFQLETLRAVMKQINFVITVPVRKADKK